MIGVGIAGLVLSRLFAGGFGILECLIVLAVLLSGLVIGTLLNFAIFAPVYLFLGKRCSKKMGRVANRQP
jgi:hypothetical protein